MSTSSSTSDEYVGYLTASQDNLRAYILACLGSYNDASDVLQATNVVLLRKAADVNSLQEFQQWAIRVAKYEVLAYIRDNKRRGPVFAPELAELMSRATEPKLVKVSTRQSALRQCLASLSEEKQEVVRLRYAQDLTLLQIAGELGRTESSVKVMMHRLRKALYKCIEKRLSSSDPTSVPT